MPAPTMAFADIVLPMKSITTHLVCLFLILLSFSVEAVTYTSSGSGDWRTAGSWNPSGPPASGASSSNVNVIVIKSGQNITISGDNISLSNVVIYVLGTLTMEGSLGTGYATLSLTGTTSGVIIKPGGKLIADALTNLGKAAIGIVVNGDDIWAGANWLGTGDSQIYGDLTAGSSPIYIPTGVSDPLPITLVNWNASFSEGKVATTWTTSAEQNNQYFTIEESTDGKEFYEVAQIPTQGDGTSIHEYNEIITPKGKGILYFRLKQTDVNGDFTYSPVVSLSTANDDNEWSMFPNPVTNKTVTIQASTNTSSSISLLDPQTGNVVFQQESSFAEAGLVTIILPDNLKSGVYLLKIQNANGSDSKPLMVY